MTLWTQRHGCLAGSRGLPIGRNFMGQVDCVELESSYARAIGSHAATQANGRAVLWKGCSRPRGSRLGLVLGLVLGGCRKCWLRVRVRVRKLDFDQDFDQDEATRSGGQ